MISCTRKIEFDAAHRIVNHESKCKMLHGHRYVVEATFVIKGDENSLDNLGRVVDFGVIYELLGGWINVNFDHNTILWKEDKILGEEIAKITKQKIYYLDENPTAENIAKYLFQKICPLLFVDTDVKCIELKIYETPNCHAKIS